MRFRIQERYTADDRIFLIVEIIITFICMFIPLILFLIDKQVRPSISAYVDMKDSYIFGLLFGIAGMTFLLNGALYFKVENDEKRKPQLKSISVLNQSIYDKKRIGKWYNVVFGISLIGIAVFHYNRNISEYIHIAFALIFFVGSAIVIFFIHDPEDKWKSRILAIVSVACLAISFFTNGSFISLFWAETIALIIIAIHYILESYRICLDF
ncbi:Frag1/DRAM/Sfk1 family protein [Jejuia spongiicola]|uniref:Frag1/DRAM/Sfk1 family protein n=1 Tax=Jejuia spongiicola TaxID=2942207 RepID=A0ABT0QJ66_9FLAO|nr:Frag1/DRAM/Sfk1 family protein [Jejuia spongiicola]MCL6296035.1 Frag1/DRAM/Sfk1 family protein [Jejuia spongiicola]